MIVWLTNAADPSPSAQVDVAPSTGGGDPDKRGSRRIRNRPGRFVEPPCITTRSLKSARIVQG